MKPTRKAIPVAGGLWKVTVTPPPETGFSPSWLLMTTEQYTRYLEWLDGDKLIQEALPELPASQREILMSGIGPEEWKQAFGDDE